MSRIIISTCLYSFWDLGCTTPKQATYIFGTIGSYDSAVKANLSYQQSFLNNQKIFDILLPKISLEFTLVSIKSLKDFYSLLASFIDRNISLKLC